MDVEIESEFAKIAEYLALVFSLNDTSSKADYIRANTLSFEFAMWMPDHLYKSMSQALTNPDESHHILSFIIEVRGYLRNAVADKLTSKDLIHHAPNIRSKQNAGISNSRS